ncbi:response regulator transcription factor [Actinomyces mediterranea]|uniref:response regulator transcription factor n=1 Tax=Actinomyces mediterranea TaxID=1871028 RepID=UPI0009714827|nr:response regulator transcription factor [Actinomyces mediterranea]
MTAPLNVLLVDDDSFLLEQLAKNLDRRHDIRVLGRFLSGHSLIDYLASSGRAPVDVVLLDVTMPGMDGPATALHVKQTHPDLTIVMYTVFEQPDSLSRALLAGASGFITKDTPTEDIADVLHRVHAGETVMSPEPTALLVDSFRQHLITQRSDSVFEAAVADLPPALREVFDLMTMSLPNAEIARRTHLKLSTVKDYSSKILRRTDSRSRTQLVLRAARSGLTADA